MPLVYADMLRRAVTADISSVRTTSLDGLQLDDEAILRDILLAPAVHEPVLLAQIEDVPPVDAVVAGAYVDAPAA